jgi:hypothetical protein
LALAAFELRLKRHKVVEAEPSRPIDRYINAALIAVAAVLAWSDPGLGTFALVALAVFLIQARARLMALPAFMGLAIGGVVAASCSTMRAPPIATAAFVLVAAFTVIESTAVLTRAKRSGRSLSVWAISGLMIPGPRELAGLALIAITVSAAASGDVVRVTSPAGTALAFVLAIALANHGPRRLRRVHLPLNRG